MIVDGVLQTMGLAVQANKAPFRELLGIAKRPDSSMI
jgi:hypothetical protein